MGRQSNFGRKPCVANFINVIGPNAKCRNVRIAGRDQMKSGHAADVAVGPSLTNCMDGPCCKPDLTDEDDRYPAFVWSVCSRPSARIRSHSPKGPERPVGSPDHGCDGETVSPSPQSNSQTSVVRLNAKVRSKLLISRC